MRQIAEMVQDQNPVTMSPETSVQKACACMRDNRVGAVLVTENDSLVGIFTARDAVGRVVAPGLDPSETILADVMTKRPDTMPAGRTAIEALRMMQDGGYRHVPVVENKKLLGVVSKGDFSGREYDRLEEETVLWERTW
jgi:CBS domain-containing protein